MTNMKEQNYDKINRIEEMIEAIDNSINNIIDVTNQQQMLIDLIEASEKKTEFEQFIAESKAQIESLMSQKIKLLIRRGLLADVFEASKDDDNQKLILKIFAAFGIFEQ